jgi:hypothetical protein
MRNENRFYKLLGEYEDLKDSLMEYTNLHDGMYYDIQGYYEEGYEESLLEDLNNQVKACRKLLKGYKELNYIFWIAEVEIDIPDMKEEEVADYLIENENLYTDKIDKKVSEAEYNYGFGLGNGMDERDVVEEWRFNVDEKKYGGHL